MMYRIARWYIRDTERILQGKWNGWRIRQPRSTRSHITLERDTRRRCDIHAFPHSDRFGWTIKNFGPYYIPQKGSTIPMTFTLYHKLIKWEQKDRHRARRQNLTWRQPYFWIYLSRELLFYGRRQRASLPWLALLGSCSWTLHRWCSYPYLEVNGQTHRWMAQWQISEKHWIT